MFWIGLLTGWILGFLAAALFLGAVRHWGEAHPDLYGEVLDEAEEHFGLPAGRRT